MKIISILLLLLSPFFLFAQTFIGVAFHQSNIPFIGVNTEVGNGRFRPEFRLGVDTDVRTAPVELTLNYDLINKPSHEFYIGLGGRLNRLEGFVFPVGANLYPFAEKKFGFHIELATLFLSEGDEIFRGSWGIRYRFSKT